MELSPEAKRMRIEMPQTFAPEMVHWSDPELRNEVRTLKALMQSVMHQHEEVRSKHNTLLENTYHGLRRVHFKHAEAERLFQATDQKLKEHGNLFLKRAEAERLFQATDQKLKEHSNLFLATDQALDHTNKARAAEMVEMREKFNMMSEDLENFRFNVEVKAKYVQDTFVPQALAESNDKVVRMLRENRETMLKELASIPGLVEKSLPGAVTQAGFAAGGVDLRNQVDEISRKVIAEADEYLKGHLLNVRKELGEELMQAQQGQATLLTSTCEPLRGLITNVSIQQEGIAQELFRTVARIEMVENSCCQCPCSRGQCPCPCNTGRCGTGPGPTTQQPGEVPKELSGNCRSFYLSPNAQGARGDAAWNSWAPHGRGGDGQVGGAGTGPGGGRGPGGFGGGFGGGPGGGGHGGAVPRMPPGMNGNQAITMTSKIFEEKTARDKSMTYDGNADHGASWRSDVYDYFVSKWPDCEPWLRWTEDQGATKITPEAIDAHLQSGEAMTEISPYVFSHLVWGFLQHCLTGAGRQIFKAAKRQDGLNVWRQLVLEINSKTDCRRHGLRNRCQNQTQVVNNKHVRKAISDWEELYCQYLDAGGDTMAFEDRRGQLLRILPTALRREVFRNMQSFPDLDSIKEWIRVQMELEEQWEVVDSSSRKRGGTPVNQVEEAPEPEADEDENPSEDDMEALLKLDANSTTDEILAVQRRFQRFGGQRRTGPGGAGPPRRDAPRNPGGRPERLPSTAPAGPSKCVNCGQTGHEARRCPKAALAKEERPCWLCGKPGHVARECPNKERGVAAKAVSFGCLEIVPGDWATPRKPVRAPAKATVAPASAASRPANQFDALTVEDFPEFAPSAKPAATKLAGPRPAPKPSQKSTAKVKKLQERDDERAMREAQLENERLKRQEEQWRQRHNKLVKKLKAKGIGEQAVDLIEQFPELAEDIAAIVLNEETACGLGEPEELDTRPDPPGDEDTDDEMEELVDSSDEEEETPVEAKRRHDRNWFSVQARIRSRDADELMAEEEARDEAEEKAVDEAVELALKEFETKTAHDPLGSDPEDPRNLAEPLGVPEVRGPGADPQVPTTTSPSRASSPSHPVKAPSQDMQNDAKSLAHIRVVKTTAKSVTSSSSEIEDEADARHERRRRAMEEAERWSAKSSQRRPRDVPAGLAELVFPEGSESLMVAGPDPPKYISLQVVLDSGAGAHVVNRKAIPGYLVEASALSKAGAAFLGADGGRIANHGESLLQIVAEDAKGGAHAITSHFQVADVTRALWSVGLICDSGLDVRFKKGEASVLDAAGRELCHFTRSGGLYVATVRLENPEHPDFRRLGR